MDPKAEEVERFVVRVILERGGGVTWKEVPRTEFARHDGDCLSGTMDELQEAVAEREGLPISFIRSQGRGYGFQIMGGQEDLRAAMEYSQRTGQKISCRWTATAKTLAKLLSMKVVAIDYGNYVVDGKWIFVYSTIEYDPAQAATLIAQREEALRIRTSLLAQRNGEASGRKSTIPWKGVLGTMSNALYYATDKIRFFDRDYPGSRSWGRRSILMLHGPDNRVQAVWAIPKLAELFWVFTRTKKYRTEEFLAAVKLAATKYVGDPLMTPELKAFVLEESRARVNVKKEGTK